MENLGSIAAINYQSIMSILRTHSSASVKYLPLPNWRLSPHYIPMPNQASTPQTNFAKHLPPSHVLLDLDVSSKKRLFEQIGLLFENENGIARATVFDALFAREKLGSTGLGHAVAIPHGRIKGLRDTLAVFIRTKEGVPFESPDTENVRLVFAMLVPEHANEQHLNLLSELAEAFSDTDFRDKLIVEKSSIGAHDLLSSWTP
jgi:nitrogen PTS system EIIA component